VKFQVGEWPWEIRICFLVVLKCDYAESDETMLSKGHLISFSAYGSSWKTKCMKSRKRCSK
jgi:hypothetical protein